MLKSASCGDIREKHVGDQVTLAGWVNRRRDHGGVIFVDLRDRSGLVQVVFNPELSPETYKVADQVRQEWVLRVTGEVSRRPPESENPNLPTGAIEVMAQGAEVLNSSPTPPFLISEESEVDESLRLKYRYLDLRRPRIQENLILRHRVVKFIRDFLDERGFLEIETPILIKSTPEGARDFLVPSRLQKGSFYALPQSPQQLKQLLMVAGMERYFQIARCFRDEDLRADRQPEFTQLDLEMSFVGENDVLALAEELYTSMIETTTPDRKLLKKPFPRITYDEAMSKYASDKPDLRFGMEMTDVTDIALKTDFRVFHGAVEQGGVVKGFVATNQATNYSGTMLRELENISRDHGAKGMSHIRIGSEHPLDQLTENDMQFSQGLRMTPPLARELSERMGAGSGDLILLMAGPLREIGPPLNALRNEMGNRMGLADPNLLAFAWVVDFPLLEWKPGENRWDSPHNPFSAPKDEDVPLLDTEPGRALAKQYDLVCNGLELCGGSIRNHRRGVQEKILGLMGYSKEAMRSQFGQLLDALEYGAPPHGGFACGIERLVMRMANEDNIRETMAFPKTQSGADLLFGAPAKVEDEQLRELGLRLIE